MIVNNYNFIDNSQPWPKIYTLNDTDENQPPKYKPILNNEKELFDFVKKLYNRFLKK